MNDLMHLINYKKKQKVIYYEPAIEPIIAYPGFEEDYKLLAQRMVKELDLGASNVEKIKFGCLRIGEQLRTQELSQIILIQHCLLEMRCYIQLLHQIQSSGILRMYA